jgi:EAL domain-containing protein (putative c-di-GMP-specific phosphodiesterase class I)
LINSAEALIRWRHPLRRFPIDKLKIDRCSSSR